MSRPTITRPAITRPIIAALLLSFACAAHAYEPPAAADDGWPVADAAKLGWDTSRFDAVAAKVDDKTTYPGITSLVVAQDGKLVYEGYFNGGGREALNDMRSATKSITSLLVGIAIDKGLIPDVHAKVYPFFPDKAPKNLPARKAAIDLEDLLTMSSAWQCDDENTATAGHEERMYVSEDWTQFALDLPLRGFAPWDTRPEKSPYGRAFSYCTAGSFLLGAIVERAAKQPLDRFAHDTLEAPLRIAKVQWNQSSEGVGMGGGGTRYRARDIARIGEMVLRGGEWQGRRVVSKAWIDAALSPHAVPRENVEYGYQFWRFRFPINGKDEWVWAMSGNGGNYVFISPEQRLVAVITTTAYNRRESHPRSQEIFRDYLLKALPKP